jgi:hypothetical protein
MHKRQQQQQHLDRRQMPCSFCFVPDPKKHHAKTVSSKPIALTAGHPWQQHQHQASYKNNSAQNKRALKSGLPRTFR